MIHYRIRPLRPEAHLFQVTLTVAEPTPEGQGLTLPAWIPGSYMIRDFARHIVSLEARAGDRPLDVAKIDKQTWQLPPVDGPVTVDYQVYAWDLSVRGAHLDTTHGYFNGPCVFWPPWVSRTSPVKWTSRPRPAPPTAPGSWPPAWSG